MAKTLHGQGLKAYCHGLAFTKEARDMVARIRSSPPSRNPQEHQGNGRVWYPSEKMADIIRAESRRVEFPWFLGAEYDQDIFG